MLQVLWNGMNQDNPDNANKLADFMNQGLSEPNKILVVKMADTWYILVGNDIAKKWYDEVSESAKRIHDKKAEIA